MKSVSFRSHVGADGILNLQVPIGITNTELEVMVIIQPFAKPEIEKPEHTRWMAGFFDEVIGSWEGEPLVRSEQGEYEMREELK
ncbi:MAG: hypothetical protein KME16_21990 [Scytolyngbya sp. HA4215-MV1]|jgi:hypothetical protein|nr:hypothetical protein [Scytolyngbya sp. HA4215-MV1]